MRVLITGATGFVGTHLVSHLLARGDEVVGTFTGIHPDPAPVSMHPLDVLDERGMARLVRTFDPEAIIHLAGLAHVGASWEQPAEYFRVNVLGTESLLAAAEGRRVVLASSAEVYGPVPEGEQPIHEDRPLAPASPYAMTKACAERLAAPRGAIIARTFNLIGPGQTPKFALPTFARQLAAIARGEQAPVLKTGNLSARRDFLHVADGVAAYRLLLERGEPGKAYNVSSGRAMSIAEVLERLRAISGVEARIETDPARLRPTDPPLLVGHALRLGELGWKREKSVDDALADLWASVR